ncbi:4-hydroxy-2-oxovalerate aldolase [Fusibacter sp. 3D3]|uniref:4-hydroxy-2-oxovalerate aldolase n=1 Tax=Fusibacter sp. 3D3 TaxID=1048380 RepID=UPI000852D079|nr:4-hydroxy-2-oxovalerate aldolase [Fusibacter sp. 3D3]GAU80040.1 4-hydroxy-2-oxovalerate aldolase [Fusibacter sp. 3D3]
MSIILDTTLRDGSYSNFFQFSISDVVKIVTGLKKAGIGYIEIGHGVGLGASEKGYGKSLHTDEEYISETKKNIDGAKFGAFCIPGIAELDALRMAADYEMDFVRIGTDVTKIKSSEPFIKLAKKKNMFVSANFMKSYALDAEQFAMKVLESESYGADLVYLVDSSGGMIPSDIEKYYNEVRKKTSIPLGFHGHNNLGMAIANSIYAYELGFEFIDTSLQGLGRSSGNAPTELLIALLMKKYDVRKYDMFKLLEIGAEYVRSFIKINGYRALDIISGYSDFHTSYMPFIHDICSETNVNPLELIMKYSEIDKVNMDLERLRQIASNLTESKKDLKIFDFKSYYGGEQGVQKSSK